MSGLREQVRRNNTRGRRLPTRTTSAPPAGQNVLPLDDSSPATVYGPDGRPAHVPAEPPVLGDSS